jgi:cyanophycin synthetase
VPGTIVYNKCYKYFIMTIVEMKVLDGPNIWSVRRRSLIQMLLDIEALEQYPSSAIPGFYERLLQLMPGLYTHRCSEGREGGFLYRVKEGTWMGHIVEHIALELQTMAGMDTGYGRTRQAEREGWYHVVYSYLDAEAGIYAGRCAVQIAAALVKGTPYDLAPDLQALSDIWDRNKLGPSTRAIVQEAMSRNIPCTRLDQSSFVQLGYGARQQRIQASITGRTSNIAVDIACDKQLTKNRLSYACIPVPEGVVVSNEAELQEAVRQIGFPLVIKPVDGNHGRGITTNVQDWDELHSAFCRAKAHSQQVICERYITGYDFRVLVINYKFVAAAKRQPAFVTGDGIHTVSELIEIVNRHPLRGNGHDNYLTKILVDEATRELLKKQGLCLETVLPAGQLLSLKPTANLSTGGSAIDVTDEVHPDNIALFERTARTIGLDVCGIDVMTETLGTRLQDNGGGILEVNAAPGLRMHLYPAEGTPRNVAKPIVDMLFPGNAPARIPIIAVTGTNGKTTTTRLIAHIFKGAGHFVGYTTTDGIYIGNECIEKGDCSGPSSAKKILQDPAVEAAVLECARGGILRSGLGFDHCDIGIITNIAEDHLGLQGINSLDDLARVKAVVAKSVRQTGTAILNADDDLVYRIREELDCKVALFSLSAHNPRIEAHVSMGGTALVADHDALILLRGKEKVRVANIDQVPCTFQGKALFNIANVLAATLACLVHNIPLRIIRNGLRTFENSPEQTPGRMNLFHVNGSTVLVDYAHNTHGIRAIGGFMANIKCPKKIGVVGGVGDRRDEDIISIGEEAARMFDEIIIRQDEDLRGRTAEEMSRLLETGIRRIDSYKPVYRFDNEKAAIEFGLARLEKDQWLVMLIDNIWQSIEIVRSSMTLAPVRELTKPPVAV